MDHRQIMRMLATGRVVAGAALLIAPGWVGRQWIGEAAGDRATKVFARTMAARDLALGLGTLRALERHEPARGWVALSGFADAVDSAATLLAVPTIGLRRALPFIAIAGGSAALSAAAVNELE